MRMVNSLVALIGLWCFSASSLGAGIEGGFADRVLGQAGFQSARPYFATGSTWYPEAIAVGGQGADRAWIADRIHNRVLGWRSAAALLAGSPADLVLGQPNRNLVSSTSQGRSDLQPACPGPPSADTLCDPTGVAVDAAGTVFVADAGNSRILIYEDPFAADTVADLVLGQSDLTAIRAEGSPIAGVRPRSLAIAPSGELWATEFGVEPYEWGGARRVLRFDPPFSNGQDPAAALLPPADCMVPAAELRAPCRPVDLGFDAAGALVILATTQSANFVATDTALLVYDDPLHRLAQPDRVIATGPEFDFVGQQSLRLAVHPGGLVLLAADQALFHNDLSAPEARWAVFDHSHLFAEFPCWAVVFEPSGRLLWGCALHSDLFLGPGLRVLSPPFFGAAPLQVQARFPLARSLMTPQFIAIDRSATPNHIFVTDAGSPNQYDDGRLLGWRDAHGFSSGAPADLVLTLDSGCYGRAVLCGALGLAVDEHGTLYVAETGLNRVLAWKRPFESDLTVDAILGRRGPPARRLNAPGALAVDAKGTLWVADLANDRVLGYHDPLRTDLLPDVLLGKSSWSCTPASRGNSCIGPLALSIWDQPHQGHDEFIGGNAGIAVDAAGAVYVSNWGQAQIAVYRPRTAIQKSPHFVLGLPGGGARRNAFSAPTGLAFDGTGHLWVADTGNDRLLEFDLRRSLLPSRVVGQPGFFASGPRFPGSVLPTVSRFWNPHGIAFDENGSLFVADGLFHRVLVFDAP